MTAEQVAQALGTHSAKAGGGFMASCPVHDDKTPSLAIDENNGSLLVKCFAGCEQGSVVEALKARDLWPGNGSILPPLRKPVTRQTWTPVLPVPTDAPAPPATHYKYGKPSMTWRYLSPDGSLLQIINRFDIGDGKQILPLTCCTDGKRQEWRWQGLPDPRPLYGLELIGNAQHVVIAEGEKACDAARRILGDKLPVVTWSGGSNAASKTDWQPLAGLAVAIWPDADAPGTKAALTVAEELEKIDATVKIVEPPADVVKGWDLADAEAEGWTRQQVMTSLKAAIIPEEFKDTHATVQEQADEELIEKSQSRKITVINIEDFLALDIPHRGHILEPVIPQQGLTMVFAPRGIGKTHLSLGIAHAVASGGEFLKWTAPKAKGVLLLDGEMPAKTLQERLARIVVSNEKEPTAPLRIVTPDLQESGMLNLCSTEDQENLSQYLEDIELIIIGNLSTLCRSGRENEAESWLPIQAWALQQRAAGRSVMFIHHSGKNGEQRGTSRREDVLDTVLKLKLPGDYTPDRGANFEVHFDKSRGVYGDETKPFEAQLTVTPDGRDEWAIKSLELSTAEKVANLLNEGIPQQEIAELLDVSKGHVSKSKKRAQELGLLI